MRTQPQVRLCYCTDEVRSLMLELPIDGVLDQGAAMPTPDEVAYPRDQLATDSLARIQGLDCWFEYEAVADEAV